MHRSSIWSHTVLYIKENMCVRSVIIFWSIKFINLIAYGAGCFWFVPLYGSNSILPLWQTPSFCLSALHSVTYFPASLWCYFVSYWTRIIKWKIVISFFSLCSALKFFFNIRRVYLYEIKDIIVSKLKSLFLRES